MHPRQCGGTRRIFETGDSRYTEIFGSHQAETVGTPALTSAAEVKMNTCTRSGIRVQTNYTKRNEYLRFSSTNIREGGNCPTMRRAVAQADTLFHIRGTEPAIRAPGTATISHEVAGGRTDVLTKMCFRGCSMI